MQIVKYKMENDESKKKQKKGGTVMLNLVLGSTQHCFSISQKKTQTLNQVQRQVGGNPEPNLDKNDIKWDSKFLKNY